MEFIVVLEHWKVKSLEHLKMKHFLKVTKRFLLQWNRLENEVTKFDSEHSLEHTGNWNQELNIPTNLITRAWESTSVPNLISKLPPPTFFSSTHSDTWHLQPEPTSIRRDLGNWFKWSLNLSRVVEMSQSFPHCLWVISQAKYGFPESARLTHKLLFCQLRSLSGFPFRLCFIQVCFLFPSSFY